MTVIHPSTDEFAFTYGGVLPLASVEVGTGVQLFTEDCFSGRLDSAGLRPRDVGRFPYVNPLTGPIELRGVHKGDIVAIHLVSLKPARDWAVSTMSPNFGVLSGSRLAPNLQPPTEEHVWIWSVDAHAGVVHTASSDGQRIEAPLRPFHGTIGVAPAYGEVKLSVEPGAFGGNLDIPVLGEGATLYLKANVDGAFLSLGDGHFAQGEGEFAGTAVEGAMNTVFRTSTLPADHPVAQQFDWPRIETDAEIIAVGCGKPLEDAYRVAVHSLVTWVAELTGMEAHDAYQLVSQGCTARLGNLVNPNYTVTVSLPKSLLPGQPMIMGGLHSSGFHGSEKGYQS